MATISPYDENDPQLTLSHYEFSLSSEIICTFTYILANNSKATEGKLSYLNIFSVEKHPIFDSVSLLISIGQSQKNILALNASISNIDYSQITCSFITSTNSFIVIYASPVVTFDATLTTFSDFENLLNQNYTQTGTYLQMIYLQSQIEISHVVNNLLSGVQYAIYILSVSNNFEENSWFDQFETIPLSTNAISFTLNYLWASNNEILFAYSCKFANVFMIRYSDIALQNGALCSDYSRWTNLSQDTSSDDSTLITIDLFDFDIIYSENYGMNATSTNNLTRLLEKSPENVDNEEENEEENLEDEEEILELDYDNSNIINNSISIEVFLLPPIHYMPNLDQTTNFMEIVSLGASQIRDLLNEWYINNNISIQVLSATTPTILPIARIEFLKLFSSSQTTHTITMNGALLNDTGLICYLLVRGTNQINANDILTNVGKNPWSNCINFNQIEISVTFTDLSPQTIYTIGYIGRTYDYRIYGYATEVFILNVVTSSSDNSNLEASDSVGEFSLICTFTYLHVIIYIITSLILFQIN